jgi:hypothetical protein
LRGAVAAFIEEPDVRRDTILIIGIVAIALGFLGLAVQPARPAGDSAAFTNDGGGIVFDSTRDEPTAGPSTSDPSGSHVMPETKTSRLHQGAPLRGH